MNILITGCLGKLGQELAKLLTQSAGTTLFGLDRRAEKNSSHPGLKKVYPYSPYQKKVESIFTENKIDIIIHLNVLHDPRESREEHYHFNIQGGSYLLELAAAHKVKKFIFLSSADVYGTRAENPQFIPEDFPLMGSSENPALSDLVHLDIHMTNAFWKYPELKMIIFRPAHIIGPFNNAPTNYLRLAYPLTLLGFSPMIQLTHYLDLLHAIELAINHDFSGVFNLCSPGQMSLKKLISKVGGRDIPLPEMALKPLLKLFWETHITSFPAPESSFLKYSCMVDDSRFQSIFPKYSRYHLMEIIHYLKDLNKL